MNTEAVSKKRGRPALGNVLFAKRVSPDEANALDCCLSTYRIRAKNVKEGREPYDSGVKPIEMAKAVMVADVKQTLELENTKKQLAEMTASYMQELQAKESLHHSFDNAKDYFDKMMASSDDTKTAYWRGRAFTAKAQLKGKTNEFDQGG